MKQCKYCGKEMPNAHPNKKFCSLKHKDKYWNGVRGSDTYGSGVKHEWDDVVGDDGDACFNSDFGDQ